MHLAFYRDRDIKITGRKEAEHRTEAEADIELTVLLLGLIAAEALWEGSGAKALALHHRMIADRSRLDPRALTGAGPSTFQP